MATNKRNTVKIEKSSASLAIIALLEGAEKIGSLYQNLCNEFTKICPKFYLIKFGFAARNDACRLSEATKAGCSDAAIKELIALQAELRTGIIAMRTKQGLETDKDSVSQALSNYNSNVKAYSPGYTGTRTVGAKAKKAKAGKAKTPKAGKAGEDAGVSVKELAEKNPQQIRVMLSQVIAGLTENMAAKRKAKISVKSLVAVIELLGEAEEMLALVG